MRGAALKVTPRRWVDVLAVTLNDPASPLLGDAVAVLRRGPCAKDQTNAGDAVTATRGR